ncbi:MAG: hypothetical protein KGQ46_05595 [Hyphomicrobiales bacterium]|nr:hypothetical protein [Hyphomicrobiales bacterium]MDE2115770.1 hypothetical protein [Hyphomicrobiales bacterium]
MDRKFWKKTFALLVLLAGFAGGVMPLAQGDEDAPNSSPVLAYGDRDRTCIEWNNACQLCKRGVDQAPVCSTPGIACTPGPIVCSKRQ